MTTSPLYELRGACERRGEHVFERLHRGSAARGLRGSGLGLAIVEQVADAHDAVIALDPAPGGGTTARLRFSGARGIPAAPR